MCHCFQLGGGALPTAWNGLSSSLVLLAPFFQGECTNYFGLSSLPVPFLDWAAAGADHTSYLGPPGGIGANRPAIQLFWAARGVGANRPAILGCRRDDHTRYFGPPGGMGVGRGGGGGKQTS